MTIRQHVVLDIDGVLACPAVLAHQVPFFQAKGAIIEACGLTHGVFPGVIEFLRSLFQMHNVKVSFFSAGGSERNQLFVDRLLHQALQDNYAATKDKVRVFSREHLHKVSKVTRNGGQLSTEECFKKNLTAVLDPDTDLKNTILIDDTPEVVPGIQYKNHLLVPGTDAEHFEELETKKVRIYHQEGFRLFDCFAICHFSGKYLKEDDVKKGRDLMILKEQGIFKVGFIHKDSREYQEKDITPPALAGTLEALYQEKLEEGPMTYFSIDDQKLCEEICDLVSSFDGISRKICRSVNRIYYVAGLLFASLEDSQREGIPLSEALFRRQYEIDTDDGQVSFRNLRKIDSLYHLGLERLRAVNPDLRFTTPHEYAKIIDESLVREALDVARVLSLT